MIYPSVGNTELALNGLLVCVCVCVLGGGGGWSGYKHKYTEKQSGKNGGKSSLNQDSYWKEIKANMKIANA